MYLVDVHFRRHHLVGSSFVIYCMHEQMHFAFLGLGPSSGSNSIWVKIDNGQEVYITIII